jgi:hypothetical protein
MRGKDLKNASRSVLRLGLGLGLGLFDGDKDGMGGKDLKNASR